MLAEQLRRKVPGGVGRYAEHLYRGTHEILSSPTSIVLLASKSRGDGTDLMVGLGTYVPITSLPSKFATRAYERGIIKMPSDIDILHCPSLLTPGGRKANRQKTVVAVHDLAWRSYRYTTTRRGARWHDRALARAIQVADRFVVPSQVICEELLTCGIEKDRISVIPYGADHLSVSTDKSAQNLLKEAGVQGQYLLSVGTLEPRKNLPMLFSAFDQAVPELDNEITLVVVGPKGWGNALGELLPQRIRHRIIAVGQVDDATLGGLYAAAHGVIYVPLHEGFGFPPLEAMGYGTPVLVSNTVPSVTSLTGPFSPAIVVAPTSLTQISAGIVELVRDEPLRQDLIAKGIKHFAERTWKKSAESHISLWKTLI